MLFLTNQQLQIVIAELDQAIYSHEQWYKNLLRTLIAHVPSDETDLALDAHQQCCFGRWYMGPQEKFLLENPTFISIGEAHKKTHRCAGELIKKTLNGLTIPVSDWDHFINNLDQMRLEIKSLRHEFAETVQNRDPLTEAITRANMLTDLREQLALTIRGKQTCSIAMVDLDHFKRINDEYGHSTGDSVLVSTVQCIKSRLRSYDRIYRYGGEEFLLCMPSTNLEQTREVIERIRLTIEKQHFEFDNLKVTASFGVTVLSEFQTVEESINCADIAMYKAKNKGRNCIVFNA